MKKIVFTLLFVLSSLMADATVGTGSASGNYYDMMKDIASPTYCGKDVRMNVLTSDGSLDNLNGLGNKKYTMGVVQADALFSQAKTNPAVNMNLIKIISGLHVETLHLLVPAGYQPQGADNQSLFEKWTSGSKQKPVRLSTLKNQTVSSWGGSLVSAKALSYFFGLNWKINTITEAQAVNTNTPILLVGGQPYAPVEKLLATGKWYMLPIDYNSISGVAPFYQRVSASYKIFGKIQSVPTVGVQALLVGKSFRNDARNQDAIKLAQCIQTNLADLADDSSTNPNWNSVYELNKKNVLLNWTYFGK